MLEVQRGVDIDSGYLCTWDEREDENAPVEASGDIKKVPLQGGLSAGDAELGARNSSVRGSSHSRHHEFTELRKSRRSTKKPRTRQNVSFGAEQDPLRSGGQEGIEMKSLTPEPRDNGMVALEPSPSGLTLTNALKSSVKKAKLSAKRASPSPSGEALVASNDAALSDLEQSKSGADELLVPSEPPQPEMV